MRLHVGLVGPSEHADLHEVVYRDLRFDTSHHTCALENEVEVEPAALPVVNACTVRESSR
jgi:hypothetical protein